MPKRFSEAVREAAQQYIDEAAEEYNNEDYENVKSVLEDFHLYVKEARDFDAPFDDTEDGGRKFVVLTETEFETLSYIYRDWMTYHEGNPYELIDFDAMDPISAEQEYEDYLAVFEAGQELLPSMNEASAQLVHIRE